MHRRLRLWGLLVLAGMLAGLWFGLGGAVSAEDGLPTPDPFDPSLAEPGTYDLGGGNYVAIIPVAGEPEDSTSRYPSNDTYVDQLFASATYCSDSSLVVGHDVDEFKNHYYQRSFLGFHLTVVPADATVTSARLYAYMRTSYGASGYVIGAFRALSSWVCPSWNTRPTVNTFYESTRTVGTSSAWHNWTITSLVNNYWKGKSFGSAPNYGVALIGLQNDVDYRRSFDSRQGSSDPYLYVAYTLPTPTPTSTPTRTNTPPPTKTFTPTSTDWPTPVKTWTPTPSPTDTATSTATVTDQPRCPDQYEPNETFAGAIPVQEGDIYSYICSSLDQDWFSTYLVRGQSLALTLSEQPANYHLELFSPQGLLVADSGRNAGGDAFAQAKPDAIRYVAGKAEGEYRIRVRGVGGAFDAGNAYRLKIEKGDPPTATHTPPPSSTPTHTPVCPVDAYEPNDAWEHAAPIGTGLEVRAYICPDWDWDHYYFTAPAATQIRARLYDLPQNYQLALYAPDGHLLGSAGGTGTAPRELTYATATGGDYLVRVIPASVGDRDDTYSLRVDLTDLSPFCLYPEADTWVSEQDPDDNFGDEGSIYVGQDEFLYRQHGLFRFDLSDVPETTLHEATFQAYLFNGDRSIDIDLRRVIQPWDEDTVTFNTAPASMDIGVSSSVGPTEFVYYSWDVTDLTQAWLTGGAVNNGLLLMGPGYSGFRSAEYGLGMSFVGTGGGRTPRLCFNFVDSTGGATGSIAGVVYDDLNGNLSRDGGEPGVAGVRVQLFRDRAIHGEQLTGSDGGYSFVGLPAGEYEVSPDYTTFPGDHVFMTAETQTVILGDGEARAGVNFGIAALPTPTPWPTAPLDLRAEDLEFLQVVDGVRTVKGKWTLVRMYVSVRGVEHEVTDVTGRLYRGGDFIESLAPADLLPLEHPETDDTVITDLSRTVNFLVPPLWTEADTDTFIGWVNYDQPWRECGTCWNSLNQRDEIQRFWHTDPIVVTFINVTANGFAHTVTPAAMWDVLEYMRGIYPTGAIDYATASLTVDDLDFVDETSGGCGEGWGDLLDEIEDMDIFTDEVTDAGVHNHYYGLVDSTIPHGFSGCGSTPGFAAAGLFDPGDTVSAGRTLAHEVGHNLGRRHTFCRGDEGNPDGSYPYAGGLIGVYGMDLRDPINPAYLDPATWSDIMSYCGNRWISDWTFDALATQLSLHTLGASGQADMAYAPQEYLIATGTIREGLVTMERPFYRLMRPVGTDDEAGTGPYSITLEDAGGMSLFTRYFDTLGDSAYPVDGRGDFSETLPWQQGTAQIVIREGETVLLVTPVSANPPAVTLLSPFCGDVWPAYGSATITWEGSDPDGDPLRYALQYSTDEGMSWTAIATNLVDTAYVVDTGTLAGSERVQVRVVASDGVNTTFSETSGAITVGAKPPQVFIGQPADGNEYLTGALVIMEGGATDLEDGAMTDGSAFTWSSSIEGFLGNGRQIYLDDLLPGEHLITLRAVDSDMFIGEASVAIYVGSRPRLPVILK